MVGRRSLRRLPQLDLGRRMADSPISTADFTAGPRIEVVAASSTGRPIKLHYFGNRAAALRVLVVGGQHAKQPVVQQALDQWAGWLADGESESRRNRTLENAHLAILPKASPDGKDIGRDCVELARAESQVLHRVIDSWQPQLIIEAQTFAARQKHLLAHDLELCHDVFFDIPTNPAACAATQDRLDESFLAYGVGQLSRQSILASRYMRVSRKGSVRHGSADIRWGRNLWPLRFGIPTVSVIGRNDADDPRAAQAMVEALRTSVDWAIEQAQRLTAPPTMPQPGEEVVVAARYTEHAAPARMIFFRPSSGKLDQVELPGRFTPRLTESRQIELPAAYAIRHDCRKILRLLRRQKFAEDHAAGWSREPLHHCRASFHVPEAFDASDHAIISTTQPGGHLLGLLLAAESKYSLLSTDDEAQCVVRLRKSTHRTRAAA